MECKNCGKTIPKDHKFFCSYDCFKIHSLKTRRVFFQCKNCGKKFSVKKSEAKRNNRSFCNLKCRSQFGKVKAICVFCGKSYKTYRSYKKDGSKYCSKKCFYKHKRSLMMGKGNPNYKTGDRKIANRLRGVKKYKEWRLAVFARDKYICQMCKKKFEADGLNSHHIKRMWQLMRDYKKEKIDIQDDYFYDISNGKTLCIKCHGTTFGKVNDDIIE